jgi:hypothetical protein
VYNLPEEDQSFQTDDFRATIVKLTAGKAP